MNDLQFASVALVAALATVIVLQRWIDRFIAQPIED